MRQQRQTALEMAQRLGIGPALQGVRGGLLQIRHGAGVVPARNKVQRQLGRMLAGPRPIAGLQPHPDPPMELELACHRQPVVHHMLVQGVHERIALRDGPIGPLLRPAPAQELTAPHQGLTRLLHLPAGALRAGDHGRAGKLDPHHAGALQERLLRRAVPLKLLHNHVLYALRHLGVASARPTAAPTVPPPRLSSPAAPRRPPPAL